MRLALQIFRKDFERLWWIVLLTLVLLAVFAFDDATRTVVAYSGGRAPNNNGWLNIALPFAWSLLIALVINQDPLAGDRQFWVSLPCGWQPLAAAKTAFIAASVQIPYLIATATILAAKRLNPFEHIPHLLWKQLVLLAFILPAVAIAAVVKNIAQFVLVLMTVAGLLILLTNRINQGYFADTTWDVRWSMALVTLAVGALITAILQFVRRSTPVSRVIGVVAVFVAFSLYNGLSRDASAAIRAALFPAKRGAPVSVTLGTIGPSLNEQRRYYNYNRTTFLLPIQISGLESRARFDLISLTLSNGAATYEAQWARSSAEIRSQRISTGLDMYNAGVPSFQWLEVGSADIAKRLLSGPVTLKGRMLMRFYEPGPATTLRAAGRTDVPGLGYCVGSRGSSGREYDTLTAYECNSPEITTGEMLLNGGRPFAGRGLGVPSRYPQDPWLSPLHDGAFMFSWAKDAPLRSRSDTIAPATSLGSAVIDYTFRYVDLQQFSVREARR